jgi:hypothetical protein
LTPLNWSGPVIGQASTDDKKLRLLWIREARGPTIIRFILIGSVSNPNRDRFAPK